MTGISGGGVPPIKFDANGNVLANINAQNINPNIANPYAPQLLSHQTGLSYTPSTANTWGNMGTSVTVPRNGIVKIILMGHTGGSGFTVSWQWVLTRGTTKYNVIDVNGNSTYSSTTNVSSARFVPRYLYTYGAGLYVVELLLLANDVLQLQGTSSAGGDTVYADDVVVILQ